MGISPGSCVGDVMIMVGIVSAFFVNLETIETMRDTIDFFVGLAIVTRGFFWNMANNFDLILG